MEGSAMTLYEFRCALKDVRDNRKQICSILESIKNARDDILGTVFSGAIDYSADKVQHQSDPDARLINAIAKADKYNEMLLEKLDRLESNDQRFERMICEDDSIAGEVIRLYILDGLSWKEVALQLKYSESYVRGLWNNGTIAMWERFEKANG